MHIAAKAKRLPQDRSLSPEDHPEKRHRGATMSGYFELAEAPLTCAVTEAQCVAAAKVAR
jgi:hypothetical protein